jgi:hypothetical protein
MLTSDTPGNKLCCLGSASLWIIIGLAGLACERLEDRQGISLAGLADSTVQYFLLMEPTKHTDKSQMCEENHVYLQGISS